DDAIGKLYNQDGEVMWEYPYTEDEDEESEWFVKNPYVQEHIELVTAIRNGDYINDSERMINTTRMALMGRMATYTGDVVTWDKWSILTFVWGLIPMISINRIIFRMDLSCRGVCPHRLSVILNLRPGYGSGDGSLTWFKSCAWAQNGKCRPF